MRLKLVIEYDGTAYAGWQKQDSLTTVQGALESALAKVFQRDIPLTAAGRTDAGVHASGQVAHCDIDDMKALTPETLPKAINAYLLKDAVAVLYAEEVEADFHARFSAVNKLYRYVILNRPAKPVLEANRVWQVRGKLDVQKMQEAAQFLLGQHDFTSFRDSECQAQSPVRTLNRLEVQRMAEHVVIEAEARSFLHHQIRNFAGTLVEVGLGKQPPEWVRCVLAAQDRTQAGPTAPPQGLTLARIDYPLVR